MREIILKSGRGTTQVDDRDYETLNRRSWHLHPTGYACAAGGSKMHRMILGLTDPAQLVDHISGDKLDNRRSNLRVVTAAQNQENKRRLSKTNRSGYRNVTWHRSTGKWQATVSIKGRLRHLGLHPTPEHAAVAAMRFRAEHRPFSPEAEMSEADLERQMSELLRRTA